MLFKKKKEKQTERIPLQGKIVVEIEPYHAPQHKTYQKVTPQKDIITIGRGYESDIIVHDPFVSHLHLHLSHQDDQTWLIIDQKSENGTTQNGVHTHTDIQLHSGDTITIGRTKLRFYDEKHPVQKTLKLAKPNSWRSKLEKKSINSIVSITALLALLWINYFENWEQDAASDAFATVAVAAILMTIWSAIWAIVSRISTHRAHFSSHISIISLFIILQWAIYYLTDYLDFFFHVNLFAVGLSFMLQFIAVSLLLYGSLAFATNMPKKKRRRQALLNAGFLALGALSVGLVDSGDFNKKPEYVSNLRPYLTQLAPETSIDDYMQETKALFKDSTFKQIKTAIKKAKKSEKDVFDALNLPPMPQ